MRISDWSSDVCSSDLSRLIERLQPLAAGDVGFNGARANGVAANAFIAMRPGNASGEPHYRMFRRHISAARRPAPPSGDRGGIHDNTFFPLAPVGTNRARAEKGVRYIECEMAGPRPEKRREGKRWITKC